MSLNHLTLWGQLPEGLKGDNRIFLLKVFLLVDKKTIAISWTRLQPPTVDRWREKVKKVCYMDSIYYEITTKTRYILNKMSPTCLLFPHLRIFFCSSVFGATTTLCSSVLSVTHTVTCLCNNVRVLLGLLNAIICLFTFHFSHVT